MSALYAKDVIVRNIYTPLVQGGTTSLSAGNVGVRVRYDYFSCSI
jgi:hypothetical protein